MFSAAFRTNWADFDLHFVDLPTQAFWNTSRTELGCLLLAPCDFLEGY